MNTPGSWCAGSSAPRLGPTQQTTSSSAGDTSGQKTSWAGTQHSLPKDTLTPPLDIYLHMALHTKGQYWPPYTSGQASALPDRKPTQASRPALPSRSLTRDRFHGRQFFHRRGGFEMTRAHYIYYASADLTGSGAQAVIQLMGSSYKYRGSFARSPTTHLLLCGPIPNRPQTGALDQPHPPGCRHQKEDNYDPATQARLHPGTSWALVLLTSRQMQPSRQSGPHDQQSGMGPPTTI